MAADLSFDYSNYDFRTEEKSRIKFDKGLTREVVIKLSKQKKEPRWMLDFRLKALEIFFKKEIPLWGADLSKIDFEKFFYYLDPAGKKASKWEDVPQHIKETFEKLGIPEAERKFLGGVSAQFESEVVYHNLQNDLEKQGVIFLDTDTALKEHPEIFRKYFATVVPPSDNKLAALNSAVWSGGSFIYIPKGVKVKIPLQAYFRINARNMGQFERTLIVADEGSEVQYIEGCTAPIYSTDSLHSAVVEIIALKGSKVTYTTIQNWSKDVYNLVTKRAVAYEDASIFWIDGNIGSSITMKYPSVILAGAGSSGEVLSMAYAATGQHQDAGAKIIHLAPNTTSKITSKSISRDSGRSSYRGLIKIAKGAKGASSNVVCDALLLDENSRTDTYPYIEVYEDESSTAHEATVGRVGEEKMFYLMSRGLSEAEAISMVVFGFIKEFTKELPMEYAVELNRLIGLEMEGSVG